MPTVAYCQRQSLSFVVTRTSAITITLVALCIITWLFMKGSGQQNSFYLHGKGTKNSAPAVLSEDLQRHLDSADIFYLQLEKRLSFPVSNSHPVQTVNDLR
jgi:hypothetical protein